MESNVYKNQTKISRLKILRFSDGFFHPAVSSLNLTHLPFILYDFKSEKVTFLFQSIFFVIKVHVSTSAHTT